jgi:hypothetical protein
MIQLLIGHLPGMSTEYRGSWFQFSKSFPALFDLSPQAAIVSTVCWSSFAR